MNGKILRLSRILWNLANESEIKNSNFVHKIYIYNLDMMLFPRGFRPVWSTKSMLEF